MAEREMAGCRGCFSNSRVGMLMLVIIKGRMEGQVRFCDSPAGRIAFTVAGIGPPLLVDSGWLSNLQATWTSSAYRAFIRRLAAHRTVVRYDKAGSGMSDRARVVRDLAGQVEVVEALADHLGLDGLALFGATQGAPVLVTFAAWHPERVAALVLYGGYACGAQIADQATRDSIVGLVRANWGIGSRTLSDIFLADADADDLKWFAGYQRAAASAEAAADMLASCFATDVRETLPLVQAPTLVVHRRQDRAIPVELGRELAARIPGAEMVLLEGRSHIPWVGDLDTVLDAAIAFLDRHHPPASDPDPLSRREREIAGLVALGMTNAEVAARLSIAPRTADAHLEHIRTKLNVRSRAEIAAWAVARRQEAPAR